MSSKRKPAGNSRLNFRPSVPDAKIDLKGMKPCQEQATIKSALTNVAMHVCKTYVFMNTNYKICAYMFALFVISVLADALPFPRTPFARKDNFFNVYFVKISWGWTLLTTIPFVMFTSLTYCCGDKNKVVKHLIRLGVATSMWYVWTNTFVYLEQILGKCSAKDSKFNTKSACLMKGNYWHSIDISGHCFILIYSALVFIEECRVVINWDSISDLIRKEEYSRNVEPDEYSVHNPLRNLSNSEFEKLKEYYTTFTPFIKMFFIIITILILIWDFMLLTTILYFHRMIEKLIAGFIAVTTWYLSYRIAFPAVPFVNSPGDGCFKYRDTKIRDNGLRGRQPQKQPVPKFMGNPLRVKEESVANQHPDK